MTADQSYIADNTSERERLRALVARMSDGDLSRSMGAGWTVAAVLAHMAFWDQRVLVLLDRWERTGVEPSHEPADVDWINDATRALCLAIPPRAAARLAVDSAEATDQKVEGLTPAMRAALEADDSPINLRRATHRREHLDEIERMIHSKQGG